jgi:hypothetical protein
MRITKSLTGQKRSQETKDKMSLSAKKRWSDREQRKNASEKKKGSLNPHWDPDRERFHARQNFIEKIRGDMKKVKRNILAKNLNYVVDEVGYSAGELKIYLESLFVSGMSWENWGKEWHIDHIIPVSRWPIESSSKDVNSLKNLRPLWKEENYRKHSLLDEELVREI